MPRGPLAEPTEDAMPRGGHDGGGGLGAARRRRERRLRQHWRHEQLTLRMALATFQHHSAPRGQRTARAREGGSETKNTAEDRRTPPPEEPGTQYYGLDDDDSVPELSGGRPGPVLDPGPPVAGMRRHTGEACELVLDPVVPQLGRDIMEEPGQGAQGFVEHWEQLARIAGLDPGTMHEEIFGRRRREHEAAEAAEPSEASESRSSNKMGKKGKRRRRRKKKLPKGSSSSLLHDLRRGAANEYVEVVGYSGGVHGSDDGLQRDLNLREERCGSKLDSLESFSCSWATGYATRCSSYDTCYASVLTRHSDTVREANAWRKSWLAAARMEWEERCGSKLDSLGCFSCSWATGYATRCSSYDTCYASVLTKHSDTVREANASVVRWRKSCLVAARMECMAKAIKAVKDVTWLLFVDLDLGLQLGRINAVSGRIHRMIKTGQLSIDDDDEKLGNDDDPRFKTMGPGGEKLHDGSHAEFVEFSGSLGTARSLLRSSAGPAEAGWQSYEVSEFMDLVPRG